MTLIPLHDALDTVRHLKRSLLDKQRFKGWSGPTRILSGTLAILMAFALELQWIPPTYKAHILAWGGVFLAAMLLNMGALVHWFWNDELIHRDVRRLAPMLDVMPPLFVGAVFTLVLILGREFDLLFGVWMSMFGLTNLASRYVLPGSISLVGVFYIIAGAICLLMPGITFLNPWAMGLVFFAGEWSGGLILYLDERRYAAYQRMWQQDEKENP
ncbi:MAG: hypothetical protein JJU29_05995 [Verrucomicrobia bacterium]|nr:hypothetical protein [Verrucomicrobiota bacterium]MCH8511855.1 hypothetical protein [Kiritimatiellia bacterium]